MAAAVLHLWPISPTERLRVEDGPGDRVVARLERRAPDGAWCVTEEYFSAAGGIVSGTRGGADACRRHLELRARMLAGRISDDEGSEILRVVGIDPEGL